MLFHRLEIQVMNDEGFRNKVYFDTAGVATIGYGSTSIFDTPVNPDQAPITRKFARHLLRSGLYSACIDAQNVCDRFNELNSVRQEVLVNMAYNLGSTRLSGFKNMLLALNIFAYDKAADEMLDSKWAEQVKGRATRLAGAMKTGQWQERK